LTQLTDANNHATQVSYVGPNPTLITDALGHATQLAFDDQGRPIVITDALTHTNTLDYFGGDTSSVTDALGRKGIRLHDGVGRTTGIIDPLHNTTTIVFDALDRITSQTDAIGSVIQFTYDENGNVLTQTDANNHTIVNTYDPLNRLSTKTDALNVEESWTYDLAGNTATHTDRKSQTSVFTYDALNRLKKIQYADGSTITNTWDAGDRLTQAVDTTNGTITRAYDDLNRLKNETTTLGTVDYTYDNQGNRKTLTASGQPAITYTYDDANRLRQIQQAAGTINGSVVQTVTLDYDDANRRQLMTLPNGIKAAYSFDAANQLGGIVYRKSDDTLLGDIGYAYDTAGRRTSVSGSLAGVNLPAATSTAAVNDSANRLTGWNGVTQSYDLNGNLLSDGSRTYTWNSRNQLITIAGSVAATFQYDAFGRRRKSKVGDTADNYLYDGWNFIQRQRGSTTYNLLTGGVDEVFAQYSSDGTLIPLIDALGSTLAIANSSQAIIGNTGYEPYGATTRTGSAKRYSQQYTGREDDLTGLYFYRARHYSPSTGRFISEDPIGWASGQANDYSYVRRNPIGYVDPSGLFGIPGAVYGGISGAIGGYITGGGGQGGIIRCPGGRSGWLRASRRSGWGGCWEHHGLPAWSDRGKCSKWERPR
jgi:RHS repeat-associated protein